MEDIEAFIAVIEAGSQTAAARRLGRSLQSVNRSLVALEKSVGIELVRRTTRRSFATEAGLAFYRRVKPAVAEIGAARLEAASRRDEPSGLLSIAAPVQFAAAFVVPAAAQFMRRYPRLAIDLKASDQAVDVVGEGVDLAVRIRELPGSSLKARRLGQSARSDASPSIRCRARPCARHCCDCLTSLWPSVSALPMSADDWQRHFGATWPGFLDAMRRFDPAGI
jgi:DNA-binding transcriptional LysR family regulator